MLIKMTGILERILNSLFRLFGVPAILDQFPESVWGLEIF